MEEYQTDSGYKKMPLWRWILIYVVIGVIVYGVIYYFFFANKSYNQPANTYTSPAPASSAAPTPSPTNSPSDQNSVSPTTPPANSRSYPY